MHRRRAPPAARDAAVVEVDPPDDAGGAREGDRAAARIAFEKELRDGRKRLAVAEREPHVEHLQVAALDHEADVLEPAVPRGPEDVVFHTGVHTPRPKVHPVSLEGGGGEGGKQREAEERTVPTHRNVSVFLRSQRAHLDQGVVKQWGVERRPSRKPRNRAGSLVARWPYRVACWRSAPWRGRTLHAPRYLAHQPAAACAEP